MVRSQASAAGSGLQVSPVRVRAAISQAHVSPSLFSVSSLLGLVCLGCPWLTPLSPGFDTGDPEMKGPADRSLATLSPISHSGQPHFSFFSYRLDDFCPGFVDSYQEPRQTPPGQAKSTCRTRARRRRAGRRCGELVMFSRYVKKEHATETIKIALPGISTSFTCGAVDFHHRALGSWWSGSCAPRANAWIVSLSY